MQRWVSQAHLGRSVGMVIPAYFSDKPEDALVLDLLRMTLGDCPSYVSLDHVCVVVDGDERTARIAAQVRDELLSAGCGSFRLLPLAENHGKLWATRVGIRALMDVHAELEWVVIRDGDGDHVVSDMPRLVQAGMVLRAEYGHANLLVIGSRQSRSRPMGWWRGELEHLLDGVTLDALAYALAGQGRALNLRHCIDLSAPDLSSGYKVYGRELAQELFLRNEPHYGLLAPNAYWHYGPETTMVVDGILGGAVLAEVTRLAWDGQPASSFGEFRLLSLYGELMAWVLERLEIPLRVGLQWIDNRAPSLALHTDGRGQEFIAQLREHVVDLVEAHRGQAEPAPAPASSLPFF